MAISIEELGDQVKAARTDKKLSQDDLATLLGEPVNRSHVAHLEQGLRVPPDNVLRAICTHLTVPQKYWEPFTNPTYRRRLEFEEALSELTGRRVSLRLLDTHANDVADRAVLSLFGETRSDAQVLDALNSILVFYNVSPMSAEFFKQYFGVEATKSTAEFLAGVRRFQTDAIRLFSTFAEAYHAMSRPGQLETHRRPLEPRDVTSYRSRQPWTLIEQIPEPRLPDLGYISAKEAKKEKSERELLAMFLTELADRVSSEGKGAIAAYTEKRRRKMSSLLRKFNSRLDHDFMSPLFTPDPNALRREANIIAPKAETDLERIAQTQAQAQRNLARYLAADHLDVYVATSMRVDADFVSVNRFVDRLFVHPDVKSLNLRYFNPTQSWIDDRVAKGLVEALMLRRAALTIYMAQKEDTFGKDSEASVALGQGKPVIVFVPKLHVDGSAIDSESIGAMALAELQRAVINEGDGDDKDPDPTMDQDALVARLLTIRLQRLDRARLPDLVRDHWADFDLYGEDKRIDDMVLRDVDAQVG